MKKSLILLISYLLIIASPIAVANICEKISGKWTGEWEDHHYKHYKTDLEIKQANIKNFFGKYSLSNDNRGLLHGKCKQLTSNEAYLILSKDAPWYNPCRGTLIQKNNGMIAIHFYCFSPNQSGFFKKKVKASLQKSTPNIRQVMASKISGEIIC